MRPLPKHPTTEDPITEDPITEKEVRRLSEAHYAFLSLWPGSVRKEMFGASLIGNSSIPVPFRNHATLVRASAQEQSALVQAVIDFYTEIGAPPAFQLEPGTQPPDLGRFLTAHAFRKHAEEVWMIWQPGESPPTPPAAHPPLESLTIETLTSGSSPEAIQAYIDSYNINFRTPPHARAGFGASFRGVLDCPAAIHYVAKIEVAKIEGQPATAEYAGAMSLFMHAGYGCVYNVGTFPAFRGRGVASTLLSRLLHDAHQNDVHTLLLQTVHNGPAQPVYSRAGFRPRFVREWYLPSAPGGIWSP